VTTRDTPVDHASRPGDLLIPFLAVVCDAIAIEFSFLFSYWLRFHSSLFESLGFAHVPAPPIEGYWLGSLAVVVVWLILLNARKMYGARRSVSLIDELMNIVKVGSVGMLIVMSAAFFYRDFSYSRIVFGLIWMSSITGIFIGRMFVLSLERRLYRQGKNLRQAIVIGSDSLANEVYRRLNAHPSFGFTIVGYFADAKAPTEAGLSATPHLGSVPAASDYIRRQGIELVFIALRSKDHPRLFELISECEGVNVEFMMVPDVLEILTSQVKLRELEGVPFLTLKSIPLSMWGRISKRAMDVLVASALVAVLSPLLLVIMILIRLTSRGPMFYKQERVGIDGQKFTMLKFRSMKTAAEAESGPVWAKGDDPRRTPIGVFLRKTSLDELPQLFNVLKGDMSLVGPRPERPYFVDQFKHLVPKYLDRHRVKTGITGWAQVNGLRGDTSLEERIRYDLYYIENWSLAFDIKILLMTIKAALKVHEAR